MNAYEIHTNTQTHTNAHERTPNGEQRTHVAAEPTIIYRADIDNTKGRQNSATQ